MLNQILRYEPVVELCTATHGSRLLEVGSGAHGISRYLGNGWSLTACDIAFDDYGAEDSGAIDPRVDRVVGSVLDLPFADGAFDVVVALDLLEHLPSAHRPLALSELRRVTATRLIAGCPAGAAALVADQRLASFYDRILRRPRPQWLEEHLDNGFPDPAELQAAARQTDESVITGNLAVGRHACVMRWEAIPILVYGARALFGLLLPGVREGSRSERAVALTRLLRGGDRAPTYRTIVVVDVR